MIILFVYWLPYVNRVDQVQIFTISNFRTLPTKVAECHLLQSYTKKELNNHIFLKSCHFVRAVRAGDQQ